MTSGTFSLDGGHFEVENNIWIVGDDRQVVVIDAAHDHRPIVAAVGSRTTKAIIHRGRDPPHLDRWVRDHE